MVNFIAKNTEVKYTHTGGGRYGKKTEDARKRQRRNALCKFLK